MIDIMGHELRTPANSKTNAELLEKYIGSNPEISKIFR